MAADPADLRTPSWAREVLGAVAALAVSIATLAVVASTPRAELLLRDGDSLVTTLVVQSLAAGQPQDWAMSSVLFLPETAALGILSLGGLGVEGTLLLAGVVNLVALYGALRVAAGARRPDSAPVAASLLALIAFALLAVTEASADRDALEPASLLLTTTYYSATVLAAVVAFGLARRGLDAPERRVHAWVLGGVAAASVLTNPLFAAWVTVPLAVVLTVIGLRARRTTFAPAGPAAWSLLLAVVAGSAVGFLARLPLAHLIANTGAGYAAPSRWAESLAYYAGLAADRLAEPGGAVAGLLIAALWTWCVVAMVLLARRARVGAAVIAACGWLVPVLVVVGAIALGTHAARYVQPLAFAPILGLVVVPDLAPQRLHLGRLVLAAASVVALVLAAGFGIPRLVAAASAPDPDLACVVAWTDASGRTGAGQFWTVRLPKAHAADQRSLVQVDHELHGYAWLVNRDDFAVGEVTFLVRDDESVPFALPGGVTEADAAALIDCGRYTIVDFGDRPLRLGPQRS
ncbi:hypothetical protein [Microbacterium sp. SSM24]|uniref:hypothetical protein n=1 Tax=Microbacterium sp. SSM24 TaxID=2991714 RepID=UPI0022270F87|nr:hypothetical protein [Microbacterium sp. SSM24]MCW3492928.1 hypothetical protein [Microbacterium sp. SSM24]